ncbi:agarase [Pseudoalteromonas sp. Hal040]|uniref:agarase n=1 Tax=unclassified Pseudoalteromonas TaxID=194690 RepID=UPI00301BC75D
MKKTHKNAYISSVLLLGTMLSGCTNNQLEENTPASDTTKKEHMLWDFEKTEYQPFLQHHNATTKLIEQQGNHKLQVIFAGKTHHESDIEFVNRSTWNWQALGNFAFALDIENPDKASTQLYIKTVDDNGRAQSRSVVVPAESNNTYYIELKGADLNTESGIRSNPPSWHSRYTPVLYRGGEKKIDVSKVTKVTFGTKGLLADKQLLIDNVRLIKPTDFDTEYLVGLVDEFGQNAKRDFSNKVSSTEQLLAISAQEQIQLKKSPVEGRSTFSGWQAGPKLKATGYFRTEKYQGKWSLVDPQGYLFFSTGIANVRLANTTTITGYDFDQKYIKQRAAGDLTPEDSIGLNTAPKAAWPSRYISSELRANMFKWLPDSDDPLADNYGYRREVHSGAVKKGETFSFYRANLQRKYQTRDEQTLMKKWRDTTTDRMLSWGFTSFGNWLDDDYYQQNRLPYFANAWIIGDFKTVSSGNDYWSPLPDPFDPVFIKRADITLATVAEQVNNSPWCVGVFIDNEKSWGMMGSVNSQYGLVINTLSVDATQSPTKAEFVKLMKDKYQDIAALNASWNSNIASWHEFSSGITVKNINKQVEADFSTMLFHYANQYFAVVEQATAKHLPNHLYMGARFADWGMTPEIRNAAAAHADVVSYNYYREGLNDGFWHFLVDIDKPSIIGEFHNGALDSGLLNPGLIHAESQYDRGVKYQQYMYSVIDNPYFVGAHWFQYIDSPLTGRAYDGENYNVGFVNVADIPYMPLVDAAKEVNQQLYQRRYTNNAN